jgi:hypothetical protein
MAKRKSSGRHSVKGARSRQATAVGTVATFMLMSAHAHAQDPAQEDTAPFEPSHSEEPVQTTVLAVSQSPDYHLAPDFKRIAVNITGGSTQVDRDGTDAEFTTLELEAKARTSGSLFGEFGLTHENIDGTARSGGVKTSSSVRNTITLSAGVGYQSEGARLVLTPLEWNFVDQGDRVFLPQGESVHVKQDNNFDARFGGILGQLTLGKRLTLEAELKSVPGLERELDLDGYKIVSKWDVAGVAQYALSERYVARAGLKGVSDAFQQNGTGRKYDSFVLKAGVDVRSLGPINVVRADLDLDTVGESYGLSVAPEFTVKGHTFGVGVAYNLHGKRVEQRQPKFMLKASYRK